MEIIKRTVCLEDFISRNEENWGEITATTININVFLTQNINTMGVYSDIDFIDSNTNGLSTDITQRLPNKKESDYYTVNLLYLSGFTESRLEELRTYDINNPYIVNFDIKKETYLDINNNIINGVDRVLSLTPDKTYTFDANNDIFIGTQQQSSGILYTDTNSSTSFRFKQQGYNETNTSLSALFKKEYLMGINEQPEIKYDVFIDRGTVSVLDRHFKLSEINNVEQLSKYGNNYFKIKKQ